MNRYCTRCGAPMDAQPAAGARRCGACGAPDASHAKILVSCFVTQGDSLLWMRRAHPPQRGYWAIPAGFMELGETLEEAAARELREETGLVLDPADLQLYSLGSITQINEVYVAFRGTTDNAECAPGAEALDVRFFSESELPWAEVAFPRANYSIQMVYDDIRRGRFGLYLAQHDRGELVDQFERLGVAPGR